MGFVDTLMAGHYNATDLAAVALGSSIWLPLFLASQGILMATTPLVAHLIGANSQRKAPVILHQGMTIAVLLTLLSVLFLNNCDWVFQALNVESKLSQLTQSYMQAVSWGFPALIGYQLLRSYIEGHGRTGPGMKIAILGLICNIPLNYLLIFGKFGLPELGGVGCGWATAVVMWIMLLTAIVYLSRSPTFREVPALKSFQLPKWHGIAAFLHLGVPIGFALLIEVSMFSVIALLLADLGEVIVASHQITLSFTGLVFMLPLSISMALTIRVGQRLGAGLEQDARFTAYTGFLITFLLAIISSSLMGLLSEPIARMYTSEIQIIALASTLILTAALFQFSDAIQITCSGILRGYKDTRIPLALVFFAYWIIGLPVGYLLGRTDLITPAMGPQGFWVGLIIGLTVGAILLMSRFLWISRR